MRLYTEDGVTIPAVLVLLDADPAPAGYTEDTSIEGWALHANYALDNNASGFGDYKAKRSIIKALVYAKCAFVAADFLDGVFTSAKWDALSAGEKVIACDYFCVTSPYRDTIYTTTQQIGLGVVHHVASVTARKTRTAWALAEIYNRLSFNDALILDEETSQVAKGTRILKDINDDTTSVVAVKSMISSYTDHGAEGSLEDGGRVGLFDYILGRSGTPFDADGLANKTFTVKGMANCAELGARVHDILSNGNY